jgi:DNA repair protein RAD50
MEEATASASTRRDREVQEAESSAAAAERNLSQLQTSYNIAKRSLKEKSDELSRLEKQLRDGLRDSGKDTVEDAIKEAETEIKIIRE